MSPMWFVFGFFSLIGFVVYSLHERATAKWIGMRSSVRRKTYEYQVLAHRVYRSDKTKSVGLRIGVTAPAVYDFSFKPEKWRDGLSKRIGFSVEHQTGDAEFDKTVYILSNDARIHATLSQNAVLRADILRVFKVVAPHSAVLKEVRCSGGGIWVHYKLKTELNRDKIPVLAEQVVPGLSRLAADLARANVVGTPRLYDSVKGGRFVAPREIAARLAVLRAPLGTYAVLGNHDWWNGAGKVRRAFEDVGIPVLDDRAVPLAKGACRFWLAGLGDLWEGKPDVRRALRDVPTGAAVLAFTHNPDLFPTVPASVALTMAGHTHGGQVRIPFFGPVIVPSRHGRRYAQGHIVEQGRNLFVSPGLGTSILPVRFLVPPEVSRLYLYPRHSDTVATLSGPCY